MNRRKVVIKNKIYHWKYIKSKVLIWDEEERKHVFDDSAVTGISFDNIERGKHKKYFSITPDTIRNFILFGFIVILRQRLQLLHQKNY